MPPELSSNERKYQTANPLVRHLLESFLKRVVAGVQAARPQSILDAGCGEGLLLERVVSAVPAATAAGFDFSGAAVMRARDRVPGVDLREARIEAVPWPDRSFDVVMCCEVLEHLADPLTALRELSRVCRGTLILSVPHEPWFRLGNLARGKYAGTWGNHPEHIQHWNPASFRVFCEEAVDVRSVETSFPWILATARPRSAR